ncbi:MAG: tetratricopeptide repeat protein [Bdellovibrionaceae bacterium]|nr:tetratricopeptide repeat protein [Pseudobdellovibrionaceae bacterium]
MSNDLTPAQKDLLRRANEATERKNHDYAIALLKDVVKQTPGLLEARRLLRANEIIKWKNASGFSKSMLGMKSTPLVVKGKSALKKDPAEAMAFAEDALEIDPASDQANNLLADAARAAQLIDVAVLAYETIRDTKPDNIENLKKLGRLYMEIAEPVKAQKAFEAAIKVSPNDGEAIKGAKDASAMQASRAGSWEEGGDFRTSMKSADEAKRLEQEAREVKSVDAIDAQLAPLYAQYNENNQNLNVVKKIAELLDRKEDTAGAMQWYEYAHALSSGADPEIEKKITALRMKQVELAIQEQEAALEQADPSQHEAIAAQIAELRAQRSQALLQNARDRVARYPNDKQIRFDLGKALFDIGEYKEAVPELQQALQAPAVRHQAFNLLGLCFLQRNMIDMAIKQLTSAEQEMSIMDNLKKEIIYNLGIALEQHGDAPAALEKFKTIYEVDYHFRDVAQRVEASYGG